MRKVDILRNLKLTIAYKGTNYHGFQKQKNAITVQEILETTLSKLLNENVNIYGCSRTDSGVHANDYCVSLYTQKMVPNNKFIRGLNSYLPSDISILDCEDVDLDFHARYSCKAKEYLYLIHNSESKNPFAKDLEYHYNRPLDIEMIKRASEFLVGTHDFKSFCSYNNEKVNTTRTIYYIDIKKDINTVKILVKGDGFLYNMVRIIIGTLLYVNEGKIKVDYIPEILKLKDRKYAGKTAQSHGLYLNKVYY